MSPEAGPWPVLDMQERRILGVLVEKAKTTPDAYPMSLNALVTGANQKSNRDPILNLSDLEVEDALVRCQKKNLAIKITGGRVVRWRHNLYETWHADKIELAVLGELLLRGPQTEGELRTRASRMEPLDDLDALRTVLQPLVQRKLVVYLTPEDRRGAVLTHGFHDPEELKHLRARHMAEPAPLSSPAPVAVAPLPQPPPALERELAEARQEIAVLQRTVAALRSEMDDLRADLRQFKQSLGA
ncbi:MAG TPA: DUF480 domain-containing protein [Gemmataceae bacterium]|nr:DUF480 domain-containing protein [Gemmataceae bacterium]